MKAKEKSKLNCVSLQVAPRMARATARTIKELFDAMANDMQKLVGMVDSKSQRQAAILCLFSTISSARSALLAITGATGIISQDELNHANLSGCFPNIERRAYEFFHQEFKKQIDEGSIIEPGPWRLYRNGQGEIRLGLNASKGRTWQCHDSGAAVFAKKREGQTLTVKELKALYALPSDGSPA